MAYGKWIGVWLGWINSQSVLGGLAGFALGAVFDAITDRKSKQAIEDAYQQQTVHIYQQQYRARYSFLICP